MFWIINKALDFVFSPILSLKPIYSLSIISFLVTFLILLLNRIFLRKGLSDQIKKEIEKLKEEMLKMQKEKKYEKTKELFEKSKKLNLILLKQTLKSMIISSLVFILFFPWIKNRFSGYGTLIKLPFKLPFIGEGFNWLHWYIIISFITGLILKKIFE